MFQKIFVVLVLFFSPSVFSAQLDCYTSPLSTSFFMMEKPETARLQVVHHNGVEHAPLINGIATGYTLKVLTERLEYVKQMGASFILEFPVDRCRFSEERTSCFQPNPAQMGALKVDDYYFSYYKETNQTPFGDFVQYQVSLQYRVDGQPHDMAITYYDGACRFQK